MTQSNGDYSISNQKKIYEVPAGMVIIKEGEVNLDMYKVLSGHAEMYTGYGTDEEVLIGILGPGACFGEFGLLTRKAAIYTIVSFSDMKILRVMEGAMNNFIQENQDSIMQIMRNMANSMLRMQHQITQLSHELAEMSAEKEDKSRLLIKENLRSYAILGRSGGSSRKENGMRFIDTGRGG